MDDWADPDGVLEAARAVRPYLSALAGPAAGDLDRQISEGLATAACGQDATDLLRSIMGGHPATAAFLEEVLADAPLYRPPDLQPSFLRSAQPPPGDVGLILHAGKYVCPDGDYVWYRPAVSVSVPPCPSHGSVLNAA